MIIDTFVNHAMVQGNFRKEPLAGFSMKMINVSLAMGLGVRKDGYQAMWIKTHTCLGYEQGAQLAQLKMAERHLTF